MKFNNIPDFLNAIEDRIDQLKNDDSIASTTDIEASSDMNEEFGGVDEIIAEAKSKFDSDSKITEFIFEHLTNLGYTDDDIMSILEYAGY